jgi:hypothetical protein
LQHPPTKETAETSSKQSSRVKMTEDILSPEQEATDVLAAVKPDTGQRLQSAEQLTKHATTATRKDIFLKCAAHPGSPTKSLNVEKEILFSWVHCTSQVPTSPLLIKLR